MAAKLADGYGYRQVTRSAAKQYGIHEAHAQKYVKEIYAEWKEAAKEDVENSRQLAIQRHLSNLAKLAEIRDELNDGEKDQRISAIREMTNVEKSLASLQGTNAPQQVESLNRLVIGADVPDERIDARIKELLSKQ